MMNANLPVVLAKLSYVDQDTSLQLLRAWGEGKKPLRKLWKEATEKLDEYMPGNEYTKL